LLGPPSPRADNPGIRGGLGHAAHIQAAGTAPSHWRDRPATCVPREVRPCDGWPHSRWRSRSCSCPPPPRPGSTALGVRPIHCGTAPERSPGHALVGTLRDRARWCGASSRLDPGMRPPRLISAPGSPPGVPRGVGGRAARPGADPCGGAPRAMAPRARHRSCSVPLSPPGGMGRARGDPGAAPPRLTGLRRSTARAVQAPDNEAKILDELLARS
jgi:hypothetical protein